MAEAVQPVVIVYGATPSGPTVRWHRSVRDAAHMNAALSVSRHGVAVVGYLTDVPDEWVAAAKAAYRALLDGADVSHLATHRAQFPGGGGTLVPVRAAEGQP